MAYQSGWFETDLKAEHKLALVNEPTMTINGLTAGYQGKVRQNGDPAHMTSAKLDCRLTPSQDPKKIAQLIQEHLDKKWL